MVRAGPSRYLSKLYLKQMNDMFFCIVSAEDMSSVSRLRLGILARLFPPPSRGETAPSRRIYPGLVITNPAFDFIFASTDNPQHGECYCLLT